MKKGKLIENESHARSILKGITWRIIATGTTIIIAFFITGDVGSALTIGGIEFFGKLLLYYIHERIWQLAPRGSIRKMLRRKKSV